MATGFSIDAKQNFSRQETPKPHPLMTAGASLARLGTPESIPAFLCRAKLHQTVISALAAPSNTGRLLESTDSLHKRHVREPSRCRAFHLKHAPANAERRSRRPGNPPVRDLGPWIVGVPAYEDLVGTRTSAHLSKIFAILFESFAILSG